MHVLNLFQIANVTGKKKRKNKKKHLAPSVRSRSQDNAGSTHTEAKQEHTGSTTHSHRQLHHGSHSVSSRVELDAVAERPSRQSDSDIEQSDSHQIDGQEEEGLEGSSEDEENSNSNMMNSTSVQYYDSINHIPNYHPPPGVQNHLQPTPAVRPTTPVENRTGSRSHTNSNSTLSNQNNSNNNIKTPTAPVSTGIMSWFQPQLPIDHMVQDDSISGEVRQKGHHHHHHPVPSGQSNLLHSGAADRANSSNSVAAPALSTASSNMGSSIAYVRNLFSGKSANYDRRSVVPVISTASSRLGVLEEEQNTDQPIFTVEKPRIPFQTSNIRASVADPSAISVHGTSTHIVATSISTSGRPYLTSNENNLIEESV
jgi:hypothetical protein